MLLWLNKSAESVTGSPVFRIIGWLTSPYKPNFLAGYKDLSSSWRESNYEMDQELIPMVDALFEDIKPLYTQLHAYVRNKLKDAYPEHEIDPEGPIPAHILGQIHMELICSKYAIYTMGQPLGCYILVVATL